MKKTNAGLVALLSILIVVSFLYYLSIQSTVVDLESVEQPILFDLEATEYCDARLVNDLDLSNPDMAQFIILWENNRFLELSDFQGKPSISKNMHDACTSAWIHIPWFVKLVDDSSDPSFQFTQIDSMAYFRINDSWVMPHVFNKDVEYQSQLLAHEQGHFDIAEKFARIANDNLNEEFMGKEFRTYGVTEKEQLDNAVQLAQIMVDARWEEIHDLWNEEERQYHERTKGMHDVEVQSEYDSHLSFLREE